MSLLRLLAMAGVIVLVPCLLSAIVLLAFTVGMGAFRADGPASAYGGDGQLPPTPMPVHDLSATRLLVPTPGGGERDVLFRSSWLINVCSQMPAQAPGAQAAPPSAQEGAHSTTPTGADGGGASLTCSLIAPPLGRARLYH